MIQFSAFFSSLACNLLTLLTSLTAFAVATAADGGGGGGLYGIHHHLIDYHFGCKKGVEKKTKENRENWVFGGIKQRKREKKLNEKTIVRAIRCVCVCEYARECGYNSTWIAREKSTFAVLAHIDHKSLTHSLTFRTHTRRHTQTTQSFEMQSKTTETHKI